MQALSKTTNLIPDPSINVFKTPIQQSLKPNMINHQTLKIGNLGLEKLAAPRNASRTKRNGKSDYCHRITQSALAIPKHPPLQIAVSRSDQPKASKYYQGYGPVLSTVPNVTEALLVQPKLFARDQGYSAASPPLNHRQHKRSTRSPAKILRQAISQPTGSSHSTTTNELEITPNMPSCSNTYLNNAHAIPKPLLSPQRLLLVLDLNGTLLHRPRASPNYTPRPYLHEFLQYAFANHSLLVWSSAQPFNVKAICTRLFSRDQREMLLGEWGRDTLGLTSTQYKERVQVYKRLDRIWDNENLQRLHPDSELGETWGQHNTVLVDDSVLKAMAQPFNHVEVPEFVRGGSEKEGRGGDVLEQVVEYLEEARNWSDISGFVRRRPFVIDKK